MSYLRKQQREIHSAIFDQSLCCSRALQCLMFFPCHCAVSESPSWTLGLMFPLSVCAVSESPSWILGVPRVVKQQVLELLSPISHHHPVSFVAAVAAAWHERRLRGQPKQVSQSSGSRLRLAPEGPFGVEYQSGQVSGSI